MVYKKKCFFYNILNKKNKKVSRKLPPLTTPHVFNPSLNPNGISPWNKGSWLFLIHYKFSEIHKKIFCHCVFGWSRRCGHNDCIVNLHTQAIFKTPTQTGLIWRNLPLYLYAYCVKLMKIEGKYIFSRRLGTCYNSYSLPKNCIDSSFHSIFFANEGIENEAIQNQPWNQ